MNTQTTNYQQQGIDFANKHGLSMKVCEPTYKRHFEDDTQARYVFPITLKRNGKRFTITFGQSIAAGDKVPTIYDVLSVITNRDPEDFETFCSDFGYDSDSRKAERVYKAVVKEWGNVNRLFGDILEELQEIQ